MWEQQQFNDVFEQSAFIIERAYAHAPFDSAEALFQRCVDVVASLTEDEQLKLLRAHPSLGTNRMMTESSTREQTTAGLQQLPPQQHELFAKMNVAYEERFGFPFIIAVKGKTVDDVYSMMELRITNSYEEERREALQQVMQIAKYRFEDIVGVSV